MEKIKKFLVKYKVWVLSILLAVFFVRSCSRGRSMNRLEKSQYSNVELIDSLKIVVDNKNKQISEFPEIIRGAKLAIYLHLDDTISRVDRSPQLMGLHKMIKDSVKSLQK